MKPEFKTVTGVSIGGLIEAFKDQAVTLKSGEKVLLTGTVEMSFGVELYPAETDAGILVYVTPDEIVCDDGSVHKGLPMTYSIGCPACSAVFDSYADAYEHQNKHCDAMRKRMSAR